MSTETPGEAGTAATPDAGDGTSTDENAEPTPGSDNDGAEGGYTPPAGSDDPVSD